MSKLNLEFDSYVHPGKRVGRQGVDLGHGQGMSLRDYFAGQALASVMIDFHAHPGTAEYCYKMADAMLKEREE